LCHLAAHNGELVAEHGDLDVFLVRRRAKLEEVQEPANKQERDRAAHGDDPCRCAESLLRGRILSLHPSTK
jgi:hypothetical protein